MKKAFKVSGIVLLICLICFAVFSAYKWHQLSKDTHNLQDRIDIECNKYIRNKKSPGLAIGVIKDGRIYQACFGYANVEHHQKADTNTIFEIGSITKVFTAELTQILVDKALMRWDETVYDILPDSVRPSVNDSTTLLSLASHTSGFPRVPKELLKDVNNRCNPYASIPKNNYLACIKNMCGKQKPDTQHFDYSNMGYAVLADCIEAKTGLSYDSLLQREISGVLGLKNTGRLVEDTSDYATGYDAGVPACHWTFPIMYGCGGLNSDLTDMMKFLNANMVMGPLYKAFSETQQQLYQAPNGGIGKGWHMDKINGIATGGTIIWKNGGTGGFRTYIGMVPDKKLGIVVLSNQASNDLDGLALILLVLAAHVSLK